MEDEYARVREENDWNAEQVRQFPARLIAFCGVNPLRDYALTEIDRCAHHPQLRAGLKLHFGNSDVQLSLPDHLARVQAVFARANRHRMPVLVHLRPTIDLKRPYGAPYARAFLDHVLPQAPRIPVVIAHLSGFGGYDDPQTDEALRVFIEAIRFRNPRMRRVYFDVSGVAGLGQWEQRKALVAERIRELGPRRVLYGTDSAGPGPRSPRARWVAWRETPLTPAEFQAIERNRAPGIFR